MKTTQTIQMIADEMGNILAFISEAFMTAMFQNLTLTNTLEKSLNAYKSDDGSDNLSDSIGPDHHNICVFMYVF